MSFSLTAQHSTMLLKYSGISFISGAVNHGFFSGERSLWTAAVGIALFVWGAVLEHRQQAGSASSPWGRTMLWGVVLSIGLGFFTGGLQHFPDSPERSAWVVPLGFVLSAAALLRGAGLAWGRRSGAYVVLAGCVVAAVSWGAAQWLVQHPAAAGGHSHGESVDASAPALPKWTVQAVTRSVNVRMDDQMRFAPNALDVQVGETVRVVLHNAGKLPHEWVLGTPAEIAAHAAAMKASPAHAHGHGGAAAITVAAGQTGELVLTFAQAGTFEMACLIAGHYEAGMKGVVTVREGSAKGAAAATPAPAKGHDHSSHKH